MNGFDVVTEARKLIGVPFHHAQRAEPSEGFAGACDCVGLLLMVARRLGITDYDNTDYSVEVPEGLARTEVSKFCYEVQECSMAAGDVMLFKVNLVGPESHVGIYSGDGTIIHAWGAAGMVAEIPFDGMWMRLFTGVFRFKEF